MCGDRRHMGNLCISLYKSLKIITMTKAQVDLKKGKKNVYDLWANRTRSSR